MRALAVAALISALASCKPIVLSSYGALCAIRRGPDGVCRSRAFPHDGADFGPAEIGTPVIASADGVVVGVVEARGYGTEVVIQHDQIYRTGYLHLSRANVRVGQRVRRGQKIGEVGLFWASDEIVHVHWRLWKRWRPIDPEPKAAGCFDPKRSYSALELTYPLAC